jgi:hypothetical protein
MKNSLLSLSLFSRGKKTTVSLKLKQAGWGDIGTFFPAIGMREDRLSSQRIGVRED